MSCRGFSNSFTQFLINHTQYPHLFFQAFGGCASLSTFLKHCPKQDWILFGIEAETTLSLVDPSSWIFPVCMSHLMVVEEPLRGPSEPPNPTSAHRLEVRGGC